jgi:hypothetical protein
MTNPVREDECVFITYKGEASVNEMMSTRYVANRYLTLKHWNRIVVGITEWRSRPTFLELSSLASNLSSELPSNTRVALVVRPNQVEQAKIIERLARNEGVSVAYFFEEREAKNWVQGSIANTSPNTARTCPMCSAGNGAETDQNTPSEVQQNRTTRNHITMNRASMNSAEQIQSKEGSAYIWLKLVVSRMSGAFLWITGSAILVLLTMGGLYTIMPLDYEPPQSKFFLSLFLLLLFWIGWVALIVSFDCWVVCTFASVARVSKFHRPETVRTAEAGMIPCETTRTKRKAVPPTVSSLPTISTQCK